MVEEGRHGVKELIARARELSALAKDATPGPWVFIDPSRCVIHRGDMAYCDDPACSCLDDGFIASVEKESDAELIRVSPKMAKLLGEMAEILQHVYDWSHNLCEQECEGFRRIGKHGPNCPVEDLELDDPLGS